MGFVLAATGSAIGLGNLWKFPFITWENNGGAFVLVYLMCIAAVGLPIMMAELLIGRSTQKSAVGALKEAVGPAWGLVGLWGVMCGFTLLSYYTVIAGWSLFYFAKTVTWSLSGFPAGLATGDLFGEQAGNGSLQLMLSFGFSIATVGVVYFGVQKGIERIARLFLPVLFVILVLMLISALGMSGSREALGFIFRPNFAELEPTSLLEALGHSFFTLSLGMGAMITYGSYISRGQSIVKASAIIVVLDTLIALIEVPFGRILGPLFYVLVALAALTSTMSLLEVVASYIIDEHGVGRRKATLMCGGVVFVFTVLAAVSFGAVPFITNLEVGGALGDLLFGGKVGWFSMADHFVSNWMLPTGGLAVTLAAGWFMTRQATESELMDGTEPGWFRYGVWRFFIRFVAPVAVAAIIVAVIFFGVDFS